MSGTTTMIAELPDSQNVTRRMSQQPQGGHIQNMIQQQPVSTQQVSNEFYGNISAQPQFPNNESGGGDENLNYQPINPHPNPYGNHTVTPEGMPLPEPSPQRNQQQTNYTVENMPQQTLPSRDIPQNTLEYQHDEQIIPNHIPSVKLTSDYIKDYERENTAELRMHREKKYRQETAQETISSFQVPILVGVIYFIFQMPIVNTWIRKYLAFANLYSEDGNFKISGLVFKSVLFGGIYYFMQSAWTRLSNI